MKILAFQDLAFFQCVFSWWNEHHAKLQIKLWQHLNLKKVLNMIYQSFNDAWNIILIKIKTMCENLQLQCLRQLSAKGMVKFVKMINFNEYRILLPNGVKLTTKMPKNVEICFTCEHFIVFHDENVCSCNVSCRCVQMCCNFVVL